MTRIPFTTTLDAETISRFVSRGKNRFFLDSALIKAEGHSYSYVGVSPKNSFVENKNPWKKIREHVGVAKTSTPSSPYFTGGWFGYVAYEAYSSLSPLNKIPHRTIDAPLCWFGEYDFILVMDHHENKNFFVSENLSLGALEAKVADFVTEIELIKKEAQIENVTSHLVPEMSGPSLKVYAEKFERVQQYLKSGDVYQINLTFPFRTKCSLPGWKIYTSLRESSPAPYGVYVNIDGLEIFSASPELLLQQVGSMVLTKPIKGTSARNSLKQKDQTSRDELLSSEKNRAELLMITDLERNDLGKVCEFGSVEVDSLFEVESYAQVHHLVSPVRGKLKNGCDALSALEALFPGGSITGAPKKRAMEIIYELEEAPRNIYCGALGFFGSGVSYFNLPIRTMYRMDQDLTFHAGGGIVIDSTCEDEFDEMMLKASGMKLALEKMYASLS